MDSVKISRKVAAKMIEDFRTQLAEIHPNGTREDLINRLARILTDAGIPALEVCTGEAHANVHIDNCSCCAPRWGFTGPAVKIL